MTSRLCYFVLDAAASIGRTLLSPFVTVPVLFAVTYHLDTVSRLLSPLPQGLALISPPHQSSSLLNVLRVVVAWGILRAANRALSAIAATSWRLVPAPGWDWPNEIAVITGGSSGIGKAIAEKLSSMGVRIAVLDIQELPKDLQENPRVHFFHCDVTIFKSVAAAADAVRNQLGHPSILINNAGIAKPMTILETDEVFLRRIMGVNLMSMWFTTQQFVPYMIETNKGHVVTMASMASFISVPTAADYAATKAGALAFHETLSLELKHYHKAPNVLTTVAHPNFVKTPLIQGFADNLERKGLRLLTPEEVASDIVKQIKKRRGGQLIISKDGSYLAGIRSWPLWLQEGVRDIIASGAAQR
ncbi:short-chain dehydrogenase/reductase-like protein [Thermochaetoides thermophila DSM 1495]|uniref:Short-chain dehydrogenase/reductase 3 n=1 Tax=Chaetomium thermophilum (strain DSM 1495 / CBS 144.50 / IMI 039719) TaxID=759272 RepID=G0S4D5_CHATD|nr:short-chain dehydrogenase/reductase-like protein [Thermochaetoides thermophila DSM 1495]EGS22093.1 short-chain dehydrogenase/reductase-like protein [Thermochaetoides thermophila DSM 1495]